MWIQLRGDGRVIACSQQPIDPVTDRQAAAVPDGFPGDDITRWRYDDGCWTQCEAETPGFNVSLEERVEQTELALMELAALIGGDGI